MSAGCARSLLAEFVGAMEESSDSTVLLVGCAVFPSYALS